MKRLVVMGLLFILGTVGCGKTSDPLSVPAVEDLATLEKKAAISGVYINREGCTSDYESVCPISISIGSVGPSDQELKEAAEALKNYYSTVIITKEVRSERDRQRRLAIIDVATTALQEKRRDLQSKKFCETGS